MAIAERSLLQLQSFQDPPVGGNELIGFLRRRRNPPKSATLLGARYLLEKSLPGVFAVGDVRVGNVKCVASAIGEGSIAISFVHQVLSK